MAFTALYLPVRASRGEAKGSPITEGVTIAGLALGMLVLIGEAVCAAVPVSHAVGYTLSAKLWRERYWGQLNAAGYRDAERGGMPPPRALFMLGDSFVEGSGIENIQDRASNLLHDRLAGEYRVLNLGRGGSDTRDEYQRLIAYGERPAGVILVYYANDIEESCIAAGELAAEFTPYADVPASVAWLLKRSYLLDLLYWQTPHRDVVGLEHALERCYKLPAVLNAHLEDLDCFVRYSRNWNIPLAVVAIPHLVALSESRRLIEPVIASGAGISRWSTSIRWLRTYLSRIVSSTVRTPMPAFLSIG